MKKTKPESTVDQWQRLGIRHVVIRDEGGTLIKRAKQRASKEGYSLCDWLAAVVMEALKK